MADSDTNQKEREENVPFLNIPFKYRLILFLIPLVHLTWELSPLFYPTDVAYDYFLDRKMVYYHGLDSSFDYADIMISIDRMNRQTNSYFEAAFRKYLNELSSKPDGTASVDSLFGFSPDSMISCFSQDIQLKRIENEIIFDKNSLQETNVVYVKKILTYTTIDTNNLKNIIIDLGKFRVDNLLNQLDVGQNYNSGISGGALVHFSSYKQGVRSELLALFVGGYILLSFFILIMPNVETAKYKKTDSEIQDPPILLYEVRKLVADNKPEKALKILKKQFEQTKDKDRLNQVAMLLSDYNNEKFNKRVGMSGQSHNPVIARVNKSILDLCDEIE